MNNSLKDNLMCEVANMYYFKDMTQADIAKSLFISRSSVSRLLKTARDKGLVEIKIHYSSERCYYLEELLCSQFKLKEAYIYDHGNAAQDQVFLSLCGHVADYLRSNVKDCSVIGVSRGTVMEGVLNSMSPCEPRRDDLKLVQMHGCESTSESSRSSENLMRRMLHLCGGTAYYLNAPLYLKSAALRKELESEPAIQRTLELISKVELVVTGVGALTNDWRNTSFLPKYLEEKTILELIDMHSVGHIFGQFFDINGKRIDHSINYRCLGVKFEDLYVIPRVVAAVYGAERAESALGALRGGLTSVLFADRACAERVLELNKTL